MICLIDLYYSSANANGGAGSAGFLLYFAANNNSVPLLNTKPPPSAATQQERFDGEVLVPVCDAYAPYVVNSSSAGDVASTDLCNKKIFVPFQF